MKKVSTKSCFFMTYNEKYFVVLGGETRIYERGNWAKTIFSIPTKCAVFAYFMSDNELFIKSTYGKFYFVDIVNQTYTHMKPKIPLDPDTYPIVDSLKKIIYDVSYHDRSLIEIKFNGQFRKIIDVNTFGLSELKTIDSRIVLINSRSCVEDKGNLSEVQRYVYDFNTETCVMKKLITHETGATYFGDDFILYRDGAMLDYEGNSLNRSYFPKHKDICIRNFNSVYRISNDDASKLYVSSCSHRLKDYHVYFIDLKDETFVKEYPIPSVAYVTRMDDNLLVGTHYGIYQIPYYEVYPDA